MNPPASLLLAWYDQHRRILPWRALSGQVADPYHVWLSEIMLQQTTVTAVIPYFQKFLERFPDIAALAKASVDDVLSQWAGLGYYSRARNLHRCAQTVHEMGGFPRDPAGLQALPGIGPYTAAAIASIAFDVPVVPVDGNVERVVSRIFAVEDELPRARPRLAALAVRFMDDQNAVARPADFAQALFDLGAGLCSPRSPACVICPWQSSCAAFRRGDAASFPRKAPKAARPVKYGQHFLLSDDRGQILLRRRPDKGLLGGTLELPGGSWTLERPEGDAASVAPLADRCAMEWRRCGEVKHVFTHFELRVEVWAAHVPVLPNLREEDGMAVPEAKVGELALSSLMRKCLEMAKRKEDI